MAYSTNFIIAPIIASQKVKFNILFFIIDKSYKIKHFFIWHSIITFRCKHITIPFPKNFNLLQYTMFAYPNLMFYKGITHQKKHLAMLYFH